MQHIIPEDAVEHCQQYGVKVHPEVDFFSSGADSTILEAPCSVRKGTYGIDFVGAFTFPGGRETSMMNIGSVGRFCSIASNVVSGQPEHPTSFLSSAPLFTGSPFGQAAADFVASNSEAVGKAAMALADALEGRAGKITIGNDVWIGEGVFLRAGVAIGDGAVIGARAVVTRDVPPYAVVAGAPARVIRYRFEPAVVSALLELEWWKYGLSALHGVDFTDVAAAIPKIESNIIAGRADLYDGLLVSIDRDWIVSGLRFDPQTGDFVAL